MGRMPPTNRRIPVFVNTARTVRDHYPSPFGTPMGGTEHHRTIPGAIDDFGASNDISIAHAPKNIAHAPKVPGAPGIHPGSHFVSSVDPRSEVRAGSNRT